MQNHISLPGLISRLDTLASAKHASAESLRQSLKQLTQELTIQLEEAKKDLPDNAMMLPKRLTYDDWVADMFELVEKATPREQLLKSFAEHFAKIWHPEGDGKHSNQGPWLLVLESTTPAEGSYSGLFQAGLSAERWRDFCQQLSESNDPLLARIFESSQNIDVSFLNYWPESDYGGLFDRFLPGSRQRNIWLQGITLCDQWETRVVLLIYPNRGDLMTPKLPAGVMNDGRMLKFLTVAYWHLEQQIKNLAVYIESSRRQLIQQIAPGLFHHEMGFVAASIQQMSQALLTQMQKIDDEYELPGFSQQVERCQDIATYGERLQTVTHAFNRLDRRGNAERCTLLMPIKECQTLLNYRLNSSKIALSFIDAELAAVDIVTDVTLLTHALLNIINNAINAIDEDQHRADGQKRTILIRPTNLESGLCGYDLSNDGPSILPQNRELIFRQWVTTRVQGHGQGLFLVRLIAHYLGGDCVLLEDQQVPTDYQVCFRLTFIQISQLKKEIGHVIANH